jgi:hypothetical protein
VYIEEDGVGLTGARVLLLLLLLLLGCSLEIVGVCLLPMRIGVGHHALYWGQVLTRWRQRGQRLCCGRLTGWRRHVEGIAHEGHMVHVSVFPLDGVHLAAAHILGGNDARLVLEGDAVVGALGDEVGLLLARRVEEVELLAPVALALRLCAVVARRLRLVALEMALPARQASRARALRLPLGRGIVVPLLRGPRAAAG